MTTDKDIRWEQRFSNYKKALKKLSEAIMYVNQHNDKKIDGILDEIVKEGLIQRFEYTYEMAWNVMKDYALYQGNTEIAGSRDAIRYAYSSNLITKGDMWMDMIKSRIKTSHTYNEVTADEIYHKIIDEYFEAFRFFEKIMDEKQKSQ